MLQYADIQFLEGLVSYFGHGLSTLEGLESAGIEPSEILYFTVVMSFWSFSQSLINIGLNDFMCNFLVGYLFTEHLVFTDY